MNILKLENQTVVCRDCAATEALGAALAKALPRGSVVAMYGNLGAGKTVLARGFARGLGITEPVSSPTYTIVQEYMVPENRGRFYHLDLYRIADEHAALGFGVDEFLADSEAWTLLEWPVRIAGILPPDAIRLTIARIEDEAREIKLEFPPMTDK